MADLLAQAGETLTHKVGDTVEGEIREIAPKFVIFDIGGKNEGIVIGKAFEESKSFIKTLKVGDKLRVRILISDTPEGYSVVSLRRAMQDYTWKKIEEALKEEKVIRVVARASNQAGVVVDVMGISGFVPTNHLGSKLIKDLSNIVGKSINAKVIDLDRQSQKVILSEKEVSEKQDIQDAKKLLDKIEVGGVFEGEVTTVSDFGIFVKILVDKKPIEGLVHISELSWEKIAKPSDLYKEGDKLKVKVIGKDNKLSLSVKQLKGDPWDEVAKKFKKNTKVEGKVVKQSDFGVFVQLEPGVEGLLHMTKIPPGMKIEKGQKINVEVEELDTKNKKISLGLVLSAKPLGYK